MEENQQNQTNPAMGYYPKDIYTNEKRSSSETTKKQEASNTSFSSILNNSATIQSLLNGENLNSLLINSLMGSGQKNGFDILSSLIAKNHNKQEEKTTRSDTASHYEEL